MVVFTICKNKLFGRKRLGLLVTFLKSKCSTALVALLLSVLREFRIFICEVKIIQQTIIISMNINKAHRETL